MRELPDRLDFVPRARRPVVDDVVAVDMYPTRLREDAVRRGLDRGAVIDAPGADGIGTSVHSIPHHLHPYPRTNGSARGTLRRAIDGP